MNFKENFCKENNYTFVRTYYVEDIEYISFNNYKIGLKSNDNNLEEITINNSKLGYLEQDESYEFEFMLNEGVTKIYDNIVFIFSNSTIVEIRKTTKDIKNQINDNILSD